MTFLPIPRKPSGDFDIPSNWTRTMTEEFGYSTALPAWLTIGAGTPAYNTLATTRGELAITSGAVSGNKAQLIGTNNLDLSKVEAVWWQAHGYGLDSLGNSATYLALSGAAGGAYINGSTVKGFGCPDVVINTQALYDYRKKTLGLLIWAKYKHAYVTIGDEIIADVDYSATMTLGLVKPELTIMTNEAVAKTLRVARVSLTTWGY